MRPKTIECVLPLGLLLWFCLLITFIFLSFTFLLMFLVPQNHIFQRFIFFYIFYFSFFPGLQILFWPLLWLKIPHHNQCNTINYRSPSRQKFFKSRGVFIMLYLCWWLVEISLSSLRIIRKLSLSPISYSLLQVLGQLFISSHCMLYSIFLLFHSSTRDCIYLEFLNMHIYVS